MLQTLDCLQNGIAAGLHPGAQIYISRNGETIIDDALGDASAGVPMTRDSLTLWMSAGKPVTAVAALQLVERGLLSLDVPVTDVIPEFGVNGKEIITLRQILTHTAGFRGPLNNFTPGTWEEIVARACALKLEPHWVPAEKAGYHVGSSWFILGELIRRADGRMVDAYVREEIFAKLGEHDASIGMSEADFDSRENEIAEMFLTEKSPATSYAQANARESNTVPRPGANGRGPIRALGKLYESLLRARSLVPVLGGEGRGEGEVAGRSEATRERPAISPSPQPSPPTTGERGSEILSPAMAHAMCSRQRSGMFDETFKQVLDWGLGVMIDSKQYAGEHQYGFGPHASPDTFGHSGNQSSCAYADARHGLVVAWSCNGMPGEVQHQARASAINRAIYEDLGLE